MFGRSKQDVPVEIASTLEDDVSADEAKKGHPTPKRRDAQAAARERARMSLDEKAARKVLRDRRMDQTRKMRDALKGGDERYLPTRDKGPVKRFVRDYVDSRLCIAELLLPALVITMFLTYNPPTQALGTSVQMIVVLLTLVDTAWLIIRLRRAVRQKFPDESMKGITSYALLRVLQVRFWRQPKARVGLGGKPK